MWPCLTCILADDWHRLKDEQEAVGQRWYCKICTARYKATWGIVVEVVLPKGDVMYCKADCPMGDKQDIKLMAIQERFKDCKTAEQLLDAIPKVKPVAVGSFLTPVQGKEGHYKMDQAMFADLPELKLDQLYNFKAQ